MNYERTFTIGIPEAQAFHLAQMRNFWWKGILAFGIVGGLVSWLYLTAWGGALGQGAKFFVTLVAALVTMGAVFLGLTISTRMRIKRQVKVSGREEYAQEVVIDGFGVHVTVGQNKTKLGFEKLARVWETEDAFYIFITDDQAWLLPKAQMADQEEETAKLREIFNTVVESKKLKLRKD